MQTAALRKQFDYPYTASARGRFALNMKARAYNRRFLRRETAEIPQPQVFATVGDADLEEYGSLLKVGAVREEPNPEHLNDSARRYEEELNAYKVEKLLRKKYDRNPRFYFREGLTWSSLANDLSMRFSPSGFLFESKGSVCFIKDEKYTLYLLGLLNSKQISKILLVLSPTLDFHEGPMARVPIAFNNSKLDIINALVTANIDLSRSDWDAFETSWDFKRHPLI